ncbi:MAG: recombinase family protein [Rhodospirillales bacterium]|nr:recombinase family protein [Rhodospirillales bacterium]
MKAVILARVSTKEQEEFGHSLPAQVQKLQEYAEKKGFEVIKEFSFSESAGTKIRKKFEDVLAFLKSQKEMPVLLCQNVDRVTRNFRDAVDLDDMRINHGLEIHFVQDGFVLSRNASGGEMFMWEAKVFLAKQYINRLTDDAVRSMNHKLEQGEWVSKAPLGYLSAKVDVGRSTVIVDQERAFLVKRLFQGIFDRNLFPERTAP